MRFTFLATAVLLLTACQGMPQGPSGPSAAEVMANDPTAACTRRANADSFVVSRLGGPLGIGSSAPPSIEMLASKERPDEEQKKAISIYATARAQCLDSGASYRQANMPAQVALALENNDQKLRALLAQLYVGDLTFGEFNRRRADNFMAMRAELSAGDQMRMQQQAQENWNRQQAVDASLQNLNNQLLLQQQINSANHPITTNCNRMGQRVNCTTY